MDSAVKSAIIFFVVIVHFSSYFANGQSPDTASGAYIGCFRDIGQFATFSKASNGSSMVPDSCGRRCRNESYTYIGLWGGMNCWCAIAIYERTMPNRPASSGLLERTDDSQCNTSCRGNSSLSCGGFTVENNVNIFSVYSVCPKAMYGSHCKRSCNCKDNSHCSIYGACPNNECATGWRTGSIENRLVCNTDVDECRMECNSTHSSYCHNCSLESNEKCKNIEGSFECICEKGFDRNTGGKCIDINECQDKSHNCSQECINYEGGFSCSCRTGYQLEGFSNCIDINECQRNQTKCDQMCTNTDGSYFCSCRSGFSLDENDQRKCNDVNECSINNGNCNQTCNNTNGSYICSCRTGYRLLPDGHGCEDIDECRVDIDNCEQQCLNSFGSYECRCNDGYELWSDHHSCIDVDECSQNLSKCNQNCSNTIGNYSCSCFDGYKLMYDDRFFCIDIDECAERTSNCAHICTNTIGNYTCSCHSGFELQRDGFDCIDLNECETNAHSCAHVCNNLIGNYSCSCHSGYNLVGKDSCEKIAEDIPCASTSIGIIIGFVMISIIIALSLASNFILWRRNRELLVKNKGEDIAADTYTTLRIRESMDTDLYTSIVVPVKETETNDIYQNTRDLNEKTN